MKTRWILAAMAGIFLGNMTATEAATLSGWDYRRHIRLDNGIGGETLNDFPVLVQFDSGNFDFSQANADGSDIRFTNYAGSMLDYEIETWDSTNQQAAVWVKVPQLRSGAATDVIHMHHGNASAGDAQNAAAVWSNGYQGVWHLDGSGTATDSTSNGYDGLATGSGVTAAAGQVGGARAFDTSNDRIQATGTELDAGDDITVTYWIKADNAAQPQDYVRPVSKMTGSTGWEVQQNAGGAGLSLRVDTGSGAINQLTGLGTTLDDAWHMVGFALKSQDTVTGDITAINNSSTSAETYNVNGQSVSNTGPLTIGATPNGDRPFTGLIDEVRFSNVARTQEWLKTEYRAGTGDLTAIASTSLNTNALPVQRAYYDHESAGNRTLDATGNGHDAVAGPSLTFTAPTTSSNVFKLGSTVGNYEYQSNDFIDVPADVYEPGDGFTFTALVYKDGGISNTGHQTILASDRFRLQWRVDREGDNALPGTSELTLGVRNADQSKHAGGSSGDGTFDSDQWYFVALRYDAATDQLKAWLQSTGQTLDPELLTVNLDFSITDMTGFRIGRDGLSFIGSHDPFAGEIDGARFFSAALSDAEMQDVYASYLAIPEPSALALLSVASLVTLRRSSS